MKKAVALLAIGLFQLTALADTQVIALTDSSANYRNAMAFTEKMKEAIR